MRTPIPLGQGKSPLPMSFWRSQLGVLYCALLFPTQMEAQGTVLGQNNVGTAIFYLDQVAGGAYSVQLHLFDPSKPGGVGLAVGAQTKVGSNGRFNMGVVEIPRVKPGQSALLVVRWWDFSTPTQSLSSYPLFTPPLGGDPDGNGPLPPIPPGRLLDAIWDKPFALVDASSAPWIYASDTPDGNYRLVTPAIYNAFGQSLRFVPDAGDRFFRLAGATNAPLPVNIGPAPELLPWAPASTGMLRILFQN